MTKIDLDDLNYGGKYLRLMANDVEPELRDWDDDDIFAVDPQSNTYCAIRFVANLEHVLMVLRYMRLCTRRNSGSVTPHDSRMLGKVDEAGREAYWDMHEEIRDVLEASIDDLMQAWIRNTTYRRTWRSDRPWDAGQD